MFNPVCLKLCIGRQVAFVEPSIELYHYGLINVVRVDGVEPKRACVRAGECWHISVAERTPDMTRGYSLAQLDARRL